MTKLKQKIIEILKNDTLPKASTSLMFKDTAAKILEVVEENTKSIYCDGCGKLIKIPPTNETN